VLVLAGVDVVAGALVVVDAVFDGAAAVLCETGGTLETVTVFVPEPHALTASAAQTHGVDRTARRSVRVITLMVFAARASLPRLASPRLPRLTTAWHGITRERDERLVGAVALRRPRGRRPLLMVIISDC